MRILSPADKIEEVGALVLAGAHELYAGVRPAGWTAEVLSPNQRTFTTAQFPSEAAFADAVSESARLGAPMHLALNAPLYDPPDYEPLLALAERAAAWGTKGIIAADLGLLARLTEAGLPLVVTLSTMAGALNQSSLRFYKRFGIGRAVLPRHVSLREMASMVSAHPDLDFEAFVLVGRCPNEEAYCTFQHTSPARRWPCEVPYRISDSAFQELSGAHPLVQWHKSWAEADRRMACGICGIQELERIGVRYLKIVGRGADTPSKVANVALVAAFARGGEKPFRPSEVYEARFGRPCHSLTCYFPELRPPR